MPSTAPQPETPAYRPWLHRLAIAVVVVTFVLVLWGGRVTSHDAGLAVEDAPNTYGHVMFFAPYEKWKMAGAFLEHTHRLLGSFVGILAIVMCWSLILMQKGRTWLRWFGVLVLASVIGQGLMGIYRVTEISQWWALAHGIMGQVVLCLMVVVAAATSQWWMQAQQPHEDNSVATENDAAHRLMRSARRWAVALVVVVFVQLTLGATMRHTNAAMAIPDFPANFGSIIPPMTQAGVDAAVAQLDYDHPTAALAPRVSQVHHNFSHRLWALVVVAVALWTMTKAAKIAAGRKHITVPALVILGLLIVQVGLGAIVVWTHLTPPDLATAHQATGAVIIALCLLLALRLSVLPAMIEGRSDNQSAMPAHDNAAPAFRASQLKGASA